MVEAFGCLLRERPLKKAALESSRVGKYAWAHSVDPTVIKRTDIYGIQQVGFSHGGYKRRSTHGVVNMLSFVVEGVLLTTVSTFGLIGNVLSVVVLTRSIKNTNLNTGVPQTQTAFSV